MACFGLKQKSHNKPKNKPTSHRKNLQANGRKNKPKWLVSSQPGNTAVCRERALKIQTGTDDMHERTLLVKITEVTQSFQQQNGHICSYFKAEIFVFSQYQCMSYFKIHKSNMSCMP